MTNPNILGYPIHLGRGGTAVSQPEFLGGLEWYDGYGARHDGDGAEGRLVGMHMFTENWESWEMHPVGAEVVMCVSGAITLHQEMVDGTTKTAALGAGEYLINDPGVWHTADVDDKATVLFITAGIGTQHRTR